MDFSWSQYDFFRLKKLPENNVRNLSCAELTCAVAESNGNRTFFGDASGKVTVLSSGANSDRVSSTSSSQNAALTTGASYYPPAAYMGAGYGVNMVQPAMHTYAGAGAGATYMHPAISMVHPMTPALYASSPLGANPGLLGLPHQPVVLGSTQIGAPTVTMPTAVTSDGGKKTIIVNT
eukprot:g659.t1